jgi:hypothetical protein
MSEHSGNAFEHAPEDKNEDIVAPEGSSYRDEEKARKEKAKSLKLLISQVNEFHELVIENPSLWMRPELKGTRDFVEQVSHDPIHFPPNVPRFAVHEGIPTTSITPELTSGFAQQLYDGEICDHHDIGSDFPVVVVTAIDCRHFNVPLGNRSNQEKRYTLHVADGDDNIITVKVATQLNSLLGAVRLGTVLEIRSFRRGFLPRVPGNPERLALLVSNFLSHGQMEVKDSLKGTPAQRLTVKHPEEVDDNTNDATEERDNTVGTNGDDYNDDDWRNANCTSSKRLCHEYGYGFDVCVTKAYPLDEFDLEELAQDCWFVTKEVDKMSSSEKRNLLYWWFMVNVYHICGKDKRRCPPKCLVEAIRERYPNPPGVPYVGFQPNSRKRKR